MATDGQAACGASSLGSKASSFAAVIVVDWMVASHPPYVQAIANMRVVGAMTGYLVTLIQVSNKLNFEAVTKPWTYWTRIRHIS